MYPVEPCTTEPTHLSTGARRRTTRIISWLLPLPVLCAFALLVPVAGARTADANGIDLAPGATDECYNLPGIQESVPAGMLPTGNFTCIGAPAQGEQQAQSATTPTTPTNVDDAAGGADLPFTGAPTWLVALGGVITLLLGIAAHGAAPRLGRRSA